MPMRTSDSSAQPYISTLEHLGKRYTVTCRVAFDGIEYVGRLWFAEEEVDDVGLPDRAAIRDRTCAAVRESIERCYLNRPRRRRSHAAGSRDRAIVAR